MRSAMFQMKTMYYFSDILAMWLPIYQDPHLGWAK